MIKEYLPYKAYSSVDFGHTKSAIFLGQSLLLLLSTTILNDIQLEKQIIYYNLRTQLHKVLMNTQVHHNNYIKSKMVLYKNATTINIINSLSCHRNRMMFGTMYLCLCLCLCLHNIPGCYGEVAVLAGCLGECISGCDGYPAELLTCYQIQKLYRCGEKQSNLQVVHHQLKSLTITIFALLK